MLKMSAMTNAIMVQGGAGVLEAAGTDGKEYGNSVVCNSLSFHSFLVPFSKGKFVVITRKQRT